MNSRLDHRDQRCSCFNLRLVSCVLNRARLLEGSNMACQNVPGAPTKGCTAFFNFHTRARNVRMAQPYSWSTLAALLALIACATHAQAQARTGGPRLPPDSAVEVQQPPADKPGDKPAAGQPQPGDLPPPRKVSDYLADHPRLHGLGTPDQPGLGRTPIPTKEQLEKINKYVGDFVDPQSTIDLVVNQPRLWRLKSARRRKSR